MCFVFIFFFNATATTEIYTLSLHDALPISPRVRIGLGIDCAYRATNTDCRCRLRVADRRIAGAREDRKSTRLNSSHSQISYAVFCLKKKKKKHHTLSLLDKTTLLPTTHYQT